MLAGGSGAGSMMEYDGKRVKSENQGWKNVLRAGPGIYT